MDKMEKKNSFFKGSKIAAHPLPKQVESGKITVGIKPAHPIT
ncbi:MAG: hypothetical protein ACOY4D_11185 [Pseudomonadota bacterium]